LHFGRHLTTRLIERQRVKLPAPDGERHGSCASASIARLKHPQAHSSLLSCTRDEYRQ
jgi:hypothetical protein